MLALGLVDVSKKTLLKVVPHLHHFAIDVQGSYTPAEGALHTLLTVAVSKEGAPTMVTSGLASPEGSRSSRCMLTSAMSCVAVYGYLAMPLADSKTDGRFSRSLARQWLWQWVVLRRPCYHAPVLWTLCSRRGKAL